MLIYRKAINSLLVGVYTAIKALFKSQKTNWKGLNTLTWKEIKKLLDKKNKVWYYNSITRGSTSPTL